MAQIPPQPLRATLSAGIAGTPGNFVFEAAGERDVDSSGGRAQFYVGEDIYLRYCLENISEELFEGISGSDSRRVRLTMMDAQGLAAPSLTRFSGNELSTGLQIAPGGRSCKSIRLLEYAVIERSGVYSVRVAVDTKGFLRLGSSAELGVEGPEAEITLELVMPDESEADRILTELEAQPHSIYDSVPYSPLEVRPAVYLQPLRRRAEAGTAGAIAAIGAMRSAEATRVLLDLADHPAPPIVRAAAAAMTRRLPMVPGGGASDGLGSDPVFAEFWRQEFVADVRAWARTLLESPEIQDVRYGAFMLAAVGEAEDGPALASALTRAISLAPSLPLETNQYPRPRGAARQLLRAATAFADREISPAPVGATTGEAVMWLATLDGAAPPDGWEAAMRRILDDGSAYLFEVAFDHMPLPMPRDFLPFVARGLDSADVNLQDAACRLAGRADLADLRGSIGQTLRTTEDRWAFSNCRNALYVLGGHLDLLDIAVARLADPALQRELTMDFLGVLFGLFTGTTGGGGATPGPDEARVLAGRWQTFLADHRAEIEAGRRWSLDDPDITADLIPSGYQFRREGLPLWP